MTGTTASKSELRRRLREALDALPPELRHSHSIDASRLVIETPEWQRANTVMLFLSLPGEIETSPLAYRAWQAGKTVVVPKITNWEQRRMIPVAITSLADDGLTQTRWGTREPSAVKPVPIDNIDFVLVPGLGFSLTGLRLGRGMGFYDRFLGAGFFGTACGLAFEAQVLEDLPAFDHDMPVDLLATESRILRFGGGMIR